MHLFGIYTFTFNSFNWREKVRYKITFLFSLPITSFPFTLPSLSFFLSYRFFISSINSYPFYLFFLFTTLFFSLNSIFPILFSRPSFFPCLPSDLFKYLPSSPFHASLFIPSLQQPPPSPSPAPISLEDWNKFAYIWVLSPVVIVCGRKYVLGTKCQSKLSNSSNLKCRI